MHTLYCIFLHICSVHHQAYIFCRDTRYIRDAQVIAHELTYHHLHPSPLPGSESHDAPGNSADSAHMLCGKVPVSPTGTKGSFHRTCVVRDGQNIKRLTALLSLVDHLRVNPVHPFCRNKICKSIQNKCRICNICNLDVFFPYIPRGQRRRRNRVASFHDHLQIRTKRGTESCRTTHCPC